MNGRITVACIAVLWVLAGAGSAFSSDQQAMAATAAGEAQPVKVYKVGDVIGDLSLETIEGKTENITFKNLTAITFFASSCSACRAELELLDSLKNQRKDLDVLAVCVDADVEVAKRFIAQTKFAVAYYMDKDFKQAQSFGLSFTPGLILVKPGGEILFMKYGYMRRDVDQISSKILK